VLSENAGRTRRESDPPQAIDRQLQGSKADQSSESLRSLVPKVHLQEIATRATFPDQLIGKK